MQTDNNNAMTYTTAQAIEFINRAFDADGFLVNPKSKKNQAKAQAILDSGLSLYGKKADGYDAHASLLMIAYPDQAI